MNLSAEGRTTQEIVGLKGVTVRYGEVTVLENVDLSIKENDFLGIIGPNGGGKTTLLKVILGLVGPQDGEVNVFGRPPGQAAARVGYVPQVGQFDREFPISVWEVVLMGRLGHTGLFRYYTPEDRRIAREALETVNMMELRDRQVGRLSEGQKQRVLIARALTTAPRLLLLDEPTASVDTRMQAGLYGLLERLKERLTIVLVSHDIGVIYSYVDKIACLNRRLFYHDSKELSAEDFEEVYKCPVDLIGHGIPHRIMKEHKHK